MTLLEADTDGVYFAVPHDWTERDERRVVAEVAALLPRLVQLEFEGRYAAMLSHEPKNYALLTYGGELVLRGVAFRSSRAEPYGDQFLRRATRSLLNGDVAGVRAAYEETLGALRRRELPTYAVSSKVRLTKTAVSRLARAFTPEDFETVFADPMQPSLFLARLADIEPVLTVISGPAAVLYDRGSQDRETSGR